jgi:hypothetical protein
MASPRKLSQALQYVDARQQALGSLGDLPPNYAPAGPAPSQQPEMSWLDRLAEFNAGAGAGLANQVTGIGEMVTDPIGTAKGIASGVVDIALKPSLIAQALVQMGKRAAASPAGFGEVIGENINPRNLLKTFTHPKITSINNDAEKAFLAQAKAEQKRLVNLGEDLPEIKDVYDAMNSDPLVKKMAISVLSPYALNQYEKDLKQIAEKNNLIISASDKTGHYWGLENPESEDFASVRWMKDHKQKQGGGFNEKTQQRHGESDIDVGFDSDGNISVRLGEGFEPSKQFEKVIEIFKNEFEGKNIIDLLLGEGKR